jgi:hypothetical protein
MNERKVLSVLGSEWDLKAFSSEAVQKWLSAGTEGKVSFW